MQLLTFNSFAFACKYIDISFVGTCFFAKFAIFYDISLAFTFSSLLTFILQVLVVLSLLFFIFAFSCQLATASMQGKLSDA